MTMAHDQTQTVLDHIDKDHLVARLEGRDGGLRASKPTTDQDNGLIQYVWRIARFVSPSGSDSMPVMANTWLQSYLDNNGIDAKVTGVMDEAGKEITSVLFDVVDAVLQELGVPTGHAARRWKQAGAF